MESNHKKTPDVCPQCGGNIEITEVSFWSGEDDSGAPAGGSIYRGRCKKCDVIFEKTTFPSGESEWSRLDS